MGAGEEFVTDWLRWVLSLEEESRLAYLDFHVAPQRWRQMIARLGGATADDDKDWSEE